MDTKSLRKHLTIVFLFCFILFLLFEVLPKEDGDKFYDGQKFSLNGNGSLHVQGEDCIVKISKPSGVLETYITQREAFNTYVAVIDVNEEVSGRIYSSSLKGCYLKTYDLNYTLRPNFSFFNLLIMFLTSFGLTSIATACILLLSPLYEKLLS
jgi:hypothetical protein